MMPELKKNILFFFLLCSLASVAQYSETIKTYISQYKDLAMAEMQRTGVPAAITLAQGIHESMAGTSKLVLQSNNHFGIKCKTGWTGESVTHNDDAKGECFRKYPSPEESYKDHSDFLKNSKRYSSLFSLDPADYTGWANGLKNAGYATNPKYPQLLIKLIEDYQLQDYTLLAAGKKPADHDGIIYAVASDTAVRSGVVIPEKIVQQTIYPEGEFKINNTKVIFAKKGTSFLSVATQYNIDLSKIFEFNEMPEMEEVTKDQLIYLQRKRRTGNNEFHIVQPGETLHDIAQQESIRLESLRELNKLKQEETPAPGEQLGLWKKATAAPKLAIKNNSSLIPDTKMQSANQTH